jgi:hypothetical protein
LGELELALVLIGSSIFGRAIFAQSKTMRGYRAENGGANFEIEKRRRYEKV